MMKHFGKQALALTLLSFSVAVANLNAQDLAGAQKALTDAEAKVMSLAGEQKSSAAELTKLKAERGSIASSLSPATQEFEAVKADRDKAAAEAKANPSDSSKQVADNANFKFMLAERKYNKAKESLDAHDAKIAELEKRLKSNEAEIKATKDSIEKQKVAIASGQVKAAEAAKAAALKKEQELAAQKAALAETKAKEAAAQAEVERLKKELAAKAAAEAAAKEAAAKQAAAAAPAPVAAPVAAAVAASAPAKPAAAPAAPTADTAAMKADFNKRIEATNQRMMRKNPSRVISVKTGTGSKPLSLAPVAENLYQGEMTLGAGDFDFVVGQTSSKHTVAGGDASKEHLIMLDTTGGKNTFVVYPK